jgi:hypothetical protein
MLAAGSGDRSETGSGDRSEIGIGGRKHELRIQEDNKRFTGTEEAEVRDDEEGRVLFTV